MFLEKQPGLRVGVVRDGLLLGLEATVLDFVGEVSGMLTYELEKSRTHGGWWCGCWEPRSRNGWSV